MGPVGGHVMMMMLMLSSGSSVDEGRVVQIDEVGFGV